MSEAFHLYVISFTVGAEAGLALVAAQDEKSAFQILKNSGSRYCEGYSLIRIRDIGMSTSCSYGLLMESFVNAREAYDAICGISKTLQQGPSGLSAYDIAVENGYIGSVSEWLASLKGQKGDTGARGLQGEKGDTGEVGPQGPQGAQGEIGPVGVDNVIVSVSNTSGAPSATSSLSNGELTISISGIKGERGEQGIQGVQGEQGIQGEIGPQGIQGEKGEVGDVGVSSVSVTVDSLPGTPRAVADIDEERELSLAFYGLKGVQGNPGINNTSMRVVTTLPAASASTMDIVFLVYNSQTGEYDRYITQYDGEVYSYAQVGDTSLNLSEYKRIDSEVWVTQEEFDAIEIKDITKTYYVYEEVDDIEWEEPSPSEPV